MTTAASEPTWSAAELAEYQGERLQWTVHHAWRHNPQYRDRLAAAGVSPGDIRSLADLPRLPLLTKVDLHAGYPFPMLCVPEEQVVRIHASSGTTGRRTVACYTRRDVDDWAEMMARCFRYAGVTDRDRVHITPGYGLWTAGIGFQAGVERLGAMAVPVGPAALDLQLELLLDFRTTVLTSTSSYALFLGEELHKRGLSRQHGLRKGLIGSERWSDAMRRRIEALLGIETFDIIGMTETYGPGTGLDCRCHSGIHYWADYIIIEIIDPQTGEPLPEGEPGEMVVTTLHKEAMPLIRYRTRDLTRIIPGRCDCGSAMPRIERITGRCDDAIKLRGVLFYPADIDRLISSTPGLASEYRIILTRSEGRDQGLVRVEADPAYDGERGPLGRALQDRLSALLRVTLQVEVVDWGSLPRSERKTKRVEDQRGG